MAEGKFTLLIFKGLISHRQGRMTSTQTRYLIVFTKVAARAPQRERSNASPEKANQKKSSLLLFPM